ncbi:LacI family DNA-binding transcriptional regulator [Stenotrophomonas sp. MMGLT7]|uniref:LacI family DNA-binding transcriptional regulator n=1 Tax=Stenotrophomonas sp. MMGLT7 TaxID=2901227 RepID=UPI001E57E2AF|nr:LacI family DNA-binding transcriptional regulator [Stenotrophomonas sp. MMGLT7]MCD7098472.1 LacI family DNA-binding transcriptional regulator [Stenotrophomonas sp. MMGLT7]
MTPAVPRRPRAGARRVTLKDVAAHAGVGQITASRALREPDKVSPHLRERVLESMEALGYVANHVASGLASGSSRVVPVLIPTLAHSVYVPFLHGVHEVLERQGYELLLATTEYLPATEAQLVSTLLGWFPAGLLLAGVDHLPQTAARLRQAVAAGLPVVEFMDLADAPLDMNVGFSHRAVGEAVAHWFADRGYRHIGYAGTLAANDVRSARRAEGFAAALAARGLPAGYDLRVDEPFSIALGGRLLAQLLERHPQLQAVFFANDDLAAGAVFEMQRRGLQVGRDLALMGFNDLEIAAALYPSISSVAVDQHGMGRRAASLLLERLAGRRPASPRIDSGFRIIERDSTSGEPRPSTWRT